MQLSLRLLTFPSDCFQQNLVNRKCWSQQIPSSNNTRDNSIPGHHQMVNTAIRLSILFAAKDEEALQRAKTRLGADWGSDYELFIVKFRLKLKKVGKTTRPFRYAAAAAAKSLQSCPTQCDAIDGSPPGSPGFSRQEHWSGLPFPSPMHKSEK